MSKPSAATRLSLSVRLGVTAAAAVLLTAGCLSPLVGGYRWFLDVLVVVAVVTGTGLVARELTRWRTPVVLAQLLSLLVVLTVLFAREGAAAGVLPSPAAWQQLRLLADQGIDVTREQAPPVDPATGVLLLVALGIGLVTIVTDATAATWRRPALAGLPLLAVYCVPAAVLADGLSWTWFLLAACGFMLLVAADSADRVRAWGRVVTAAAEDSGQGRMGILPGSSGVRAGAVAVAAALVVPLALPALGDPLINGTGLGDGNGTGRGKGRYANPILDLRQNLTARSNEVALRLRTTSGHGAPRLRIVVDDNFDGTTWSPSAEVPPSSNQVGRGMPQPPGLDSTIATSPAEAQIQVATLDQSFLPLPYPATRVNVAGDWRYNSVSLDVVGRGVRTAGLSYSAQYLELNPTAQDLLNATVADSVAMQPYMRLPDIPESIRAKAREVAGEGTDLEKAKRLQDWLRTSFQYSVKAPGDGRDDGGLEVMEQFLRDRQGYCVHFASTMAVMARSLKIPARVAVGFLPPGPSEDGSYEYTYAKLHAWPELYFRGVGWVWFEPTPATQAGQPPAWTFLDGTAAPAPPVPVVTTKVPSNRSTATLRPEGEEAGTSSGQGNGGGWSWWWAALLVVPLGLVSAAVPRVVVGVRRRRRWGRARGSVALAETAWSMLRLMLADLGSTWPGSTTPRQVRRLLVDRHDLSVHEEAPLGRIVADLESARYAPPTAPEVAGGGRPVAQVRADVEAVAAAVAQRLDRSKRWRATWLPSVRGRGAGAGESPVDAGRRDVEETDRTPVAAGGGRR